MHQGAERPAQRLRPCNHHVVVPPLGMLRHNRSDDGTQAPTCTVPLDCASDASACGISDAERVRIRLLPACLEYQSGSHGFPAFGSNSQKFGSPGQSTDGRTHRVRRRGASGPSCAAGREPAGRPWWPCASESRGAAYGQVVPVDRYVSRLTLRSRWEFEGRCIEARHRRVNRPSAARVSAHETITLR